MPTKKYTDFLESDPITRDAKHGSAGTREYVSITCPHCTVSFVQITKENLATSKATECLKHLRVCDAAKAAGLNPPPKKQVAPATAPQAVVCTDPAHGTLVVRYDALATQNATQQAEMARLRAEMDQIRQESRREIDDLKTRTRKLEHWQDTVTDALGYPNPPPPKAERAAKRIKKMRDAEYVAGIYGDVEKNAELLRIKRQRDAFRDLAGVPYAKKLLLAACHPDKLPADKSESANVARSVVDP